MKITFVRHGETENNMSGILMDQLSGKLTKNGKEQVKKLGEKLKKEKFDAILCSDSKRARDTAKEIVKYHKNTPVIYTEELREIHRGEFIGKPGKDLWETYLKSGKSFAEFKPKGGESPLDMQMRIEKFLNKLLKEYKDKEVLLITHGGVIRSIWNICNKIIPHEENSDKNKINNCGIGILELRNNKLELLVYNNTKHLK